MSDNQLKNLIKRYLKGQCSEEEQAQIRDLLKNEDTIHLFSEVWDEDSDMDGVQHLSEEKLQSLQDKMHDRIHSQENSENEAPGYQISTHKTRFLWMRYAAAILVCVGISALWLTKRNASNVTDKVVYVHSVNGKARRSQITLSDSTVIYLGANSKLSYPKVFNSGTREVILEGEAFFEVAKNPAKPFIIHTGDIDTRVLGTSFKVEAVQNQSLRVSVVTGRVQVEKNSGNSKQTLAVLTPGKSISVDHDKQTLANINIADVRNWKDGQFVFNHTSFAEIAGKLESYYDVQITFKTPDLKAIPLTATLNTTTMPLDKILNVLAITGGFEFKINGKNVIIYK